MFAMFKIIDFGRKLFKDEAESFLCIGVIIVTLKISVTIFWVKFKLKM